MPRGLGHLKFPTFPGRKALSLLISRFLAKHPKGARHRSPLVATSAFSSRETLFIGGRNLEHVVWVWEHIKVGCVQEAMAIGGGTDKEVEGTGHLGRVSVSNQ